jgi:hypothetical protein
LLDDLFFNKFATHKYHLSLVVFPEKVYDKKFIWKEVINLYLSEKSSGLRSFFIIIGLHANNNMKSTVAAKVTRKVKTETQFAR